MCAPFSTSPNCSTDSSPQNVLTCNIALGQEASYTVLIDLGLAALHSVRDSVAPRSYVDSRSHFDSQEWLRKARSYIGQDKATGRTRAVFARCVLDRVEFQIDLSSRESGPPRMARVITQRNREARIQALARA